MFAQLVQGPENFWVRAKSRRFPPPARSRTCETPCAGAAMSSAASQRLVRRTTANRGRPYALPSARCALGQAMLRSLAEPRALQPGAAESRRRSRHSNTASDQADRRWRVSHASDFVRERKRPIARSASRLRVRASQVDLLRSLPVRRDIVPCCRMSARALNKKNSRVVRLDAPSNKVGNHGKPASWRRAASPSARALRTRHAIAETVATTHAPLIIYRPGYPHAPGIQG